MNSLYINPGGKKMRLKETAPQINGTPHCAIYHSLPGSSAIMFTVPAG